MFCAIFAPSICAVGVGFSNTGLPVAVTEKLTMAILRCARVLRDDGLHHRAKDPGAVSAFQPLVAGAVGVLHQSQDVSFPVAHAGYVFDRAIGIRFRCNSAVIVGVAHNHLSIMI